MENDFEIINVNYRHPACEILSAIEIGFESSVKKYDRLKDKKYFGK
jgi:hypothetical protein